MAARPAGRLLGRDGRRSLSPWGRLYLGTNETVGQEPRCPPGPVSGSSGKQSGPQVPGCRGTQPPGASHNSSPKLPSHHHPPIPLTPAPPKPLSHHFLPSPPSAHPEPALSAAGPAPASAPQPRCRPVPGPLPEFPRQRRVNAPAPLRRSSDRRSERPGRLGLGFRAARQRGAAASWGCPVASGRVAAPLSPFNTR